MSKRFSFVLFRLLIAFVLFELICSQHFTMFAQTTSPQRKEAASVETETSDERDCAVVFAEYQAKLLKIAERCDERGMTLEGKITRGLLYREDPFCFNVPIFSDKKTVDALPNDATNEQRSWFGALTKLREKYAAETFALAEKYGEKKRGYDVVGCVLTTLFIDPDHERARRFFGYTLYEDRWRTNWEIRQLEKGLVETPEFGWLPADRVERYRAGERFYRNEWIAAEDESAKILAGNSGWQIETEHFSILSRVSLERGAEIGRFLETYYQSWSRLFYRFIADEKRWSARLYERDALVSKRHKIILYRNRAEYLRELKKHDENVLQSVGGYFPDMRCIFVYEPDSDDEFQLLPLLAHEATHQLFNECNLTSSSRSKPSSSNLARNANYWGIEGVAVYMETYRPGKSNATLGGYRDVFRIQCAIESLFEDKTYVPLRQYVGLSLKAFQQFDDLSLLYSQASGLAFFFLHYKNGAYRNAFVTYLYLIYQGRDEPDSLEKLIGKKFEELDAEYADFMKEIRNQNAADSPASR